MTEHESAAASLGRFIGAGIEDLDRRLKSITTGPPSMEPEVVELLTTSAACGAAARAIARLRAAAEDSRIRGRLVEAWTAWRRCPVAMRRRQAGAALALAAGVHVILNAAQAAPAGWQWLMLPLLAALTGLLLVAPGGAERS